MTSIVEPNRKKQKTIHPALKHAAILANGPAYKGVPPPSGDIAKLNANEMSYGPHPEIIKASQDAIKSFHVYPDPGQNDLRQAIAKTHPGFSKEEVVAGSGSDDMLDVILRVIKPKRAIHLTPTFGMYNALCGLHDIPMVNIPRDDKNNFKINVQKIVKESDETTIIFLANPNNPTGTMTSEEEIEILAKTGALVVVDEAYIEFVESLNSIVAPSLSLVKKYQNVVVMRTLSKWAGLAGLRIGYALADPIIISAMMIAKQPYNVNCTAEKTAIKALEMKQMLVEDKSSNVFKVAEGAKVLQAKLNEKEWLTPTPTESNFVLCRVHGFNAKHVAAVLKSHDVWIRFFGSQGGALERYIRVSVGTPRDMERFHNALEMVPNESELVNDFSMANKNVKALIFDMDGVLADVKASYRAAIIETCKFFNVNISNEDINDMKAKGDANNDWVVSHRLIMNNNIGGGATVEYEDVKKKFQELYLGGLRDTETLIPSKQMLLDLAEKYPCAIVTGRPRDDCDYFLKLVGLDQVFTKCVCMEDTEKPKPDPAPVQMALKLLGIENVSKTNMRDDIYMFGDTVDDIRASTAAGIVGVGVKLPEGSEKTARLLATSGADIVLNHGMDALNVLLVGNDRNSKKQTKIDKSTDSSLPLQRFTATQVLNKEKSLWRASTNPKIEQAAVDIVRDVEKSGETALLKYSVRFGDLPSKSTPYLLRNGPNVEKNELKAAYDRISDETRSLLNRSAQRVREFAQGQKDSLKQFNMDIQGGKAGHTVRAVKNAGCYAPGGRYPLPSSVLMTVIPARVAGCETVVVASPRPTDETLAAAYVAGADYVLTIGGAQAIAAMAYGVGNIPECDIVVGPGNAFVTAAKKTVFGKVGIDMLAGPSEVLVLADEFAKPDIVAADLIAQAEHDTAASSVLISTSLELIEKVEKELFKQLSVLSTADVARASLVKNGFAVCVKDLEEGIKVCDMLAPEHLEVHTANPQDVANKLKAYGAVFIGEQCAEVTGDYASGPNHTLPTSGTARFSGGLSVLTFLCVRTYMSFNDAVKSRPLIEDAVAFAKIEGLAGHGAAAKIRLP